MSDLTSLLLAVLFAFGLAIYVVGFRDRRNGCFYALLMMVDIVITGAVLMSRLG